MVKKIHSQYLALIQAEAARKMLELHNVVLIVKGESRWEIVKMMFLLYRKKGSHRCRGFLPIVAGIKLMNQ